MSDQMNDEKFEEFLQREAKEYNAPPAIVPRDEMFAAIMASRKSEAGSRKISVASLKGARKAFVQSLRVVRRPRLAESVPSIQDRARS